MADERQEQSGAFGTDERDDNQPRARSAVPIADLMRETAQMEKSGAFMSGEDPHFTEERGPAASLHERTAEKRVQGEEHIMQFFAYEQLRPELQEVSRPFGLLARRIVDTIPRNPERTAALRKLLEAKDAAVRAALAK